MENVSLCFSNSRLSCQEKFLLHQLKILLLLPTTTVIRLLRFNFFKTIFRSNYIVFLWSHLMPIVYMEKENPGISLPRLLSFKPYNPKYHFIPLLALLRSDMQEKAFEIERPRRPLDLFRIKSRLFFKPYH